MRGRVPLSAHCGARGCQVTVGTRTPQAVLPEPRVSRRASGSGGSSPGATVTARIPGPSCARARARSALAPQLREPRHRAPSPAVPWPRRLRGIAGLRELHRRHRRSGDGDAPPGHGANRGHGDGSTEVRPQPLPGPGELCREPVPVPRLSRSCGCHRLSPPPLTLRQPQQSGAAPPPARPGPGPRPGPARPGAQRHPRGCPDCPRLGPASAGHCRGWDKAGGRWPGPGRTRTGKAGTGRTWTKKVEHRQDTARSRQGMSRLSQSSGKIQAGHGQRRQDTARYRQDIGKVW